MLRGEGTLGFSGDRYDIALFGAWSQGDDYTDGNGNTVKAGFQRGSFGTSMGFKVGSNQKISLIANRNIARDVDFPALPMDLRNDDTWMLNARHEISFDKSSLRRWSTSLYGTFVDHLMDNRLKELNPRMMDAETQAMTSTYGGRTEGFWLFSNNSVMYAGLDYRAEEVDGLRTRTFLMGPMKGKVLEDNPWQDGRITKTSAFGEFQLRPGQWQFVFSARLELNQSEIRDPQDEFTSVNPNTTTTQFNPNFSIGAVNQVSEKVSFGLWLGRAQRSGSLAERFVNYLPIEQGPYEMLGNPQIDPETNNQLDLTFEFATEQTRINADVFASYLGDYISSVIDTTLKPKIPSSPGVRRYVNIDNAVKAGFEVEWNQDLVAGMHHRMAVAYTYGQDLERDEPLPEIAPLDLRYTLAGSYIKGKLRPEVTLRYVMQQDRISTEFGETMTPSFTLLDLAVAYNISQTVSITAGARNLFNAAYYEHLSRSVRGTDGIPIYAPGSNFFISVNASFQ